MVYNINGNLDIKVRYGYNGNNNAWNVNNNGTVNNNNVNNTNAVRPAFYNLNDSMIKVILQGRQKTKIIWDLENPKRKQRWFTLRSGL